MKIRKDFFFCSPKLLQNIDEIKEIDPCLSRVPWKEEFVMETENKKYAHQTGYNKAFQVEFQKYGWILYPLLYENPKTVKAQIFSVKPLFPERVWWTGRDSNPGPPRCQRGDRTRLIYPPNDSAAEDLPPTMTYKVFLILVEDETFFPISLHDTR